MYVPKTKALHAKPAVESADLRLCFRICKKQVFLMMWLIFF